MSIYVYSLIYLKLIYFEDRKGFVIPKMNINLSYLIPICMLLLFKKGSDKKKSCVYMNLYAEAASLQGRPGEQYHRLQFTYYYVTGAVVHRLKLTKS